MREPTRRQLFSRQRSKAEHRGVEWRLTFAEWCEIWDASGKWEQRGRGSNQYVMDRIDNDGPYAVGNVQIIDGLKNRRKEWQRAEGAPSYVYTFEWSDAEIARLCNFFGEQAHV